MEGFTEKKEKTDYYIKFWIISKYEQAEIFSVLKMTTAPTLSLPQWKGHAVDLYSFW